MKKILLVFILALLVTAIAAGAVYVYTHHISTVTEAENYFIESRRTVFIQQDVQLDELKSYLQASGQLYVPISELTLSHATAVDGGYTVNTYSDWKLNCSGQIYAFTFFISNLGNISKQNETLIWEGQECLD